jgi:hypothetical protein
MAVRTILTGGEVVTPDGLRRVDLVRPVGDDVP